MKIMLVVCVLALAACTANPAAPTSEVPTASTTPRPSEERPSASPSEDELGVEVDPHGGTVLFDAATAGQDTAWAAGYYTSAEDEPSYGLLLRRDGTRWHVEVQASQRFPDALDSFVRGVDADGPDNVWAVGDIGDLTEDYEDVRRPFALRWDGRDWETLRPSDLPKLDSLNDVAVDGSRAFLVGRRGDDKTSIPVFLTWNGRGFGRREFPGGSRFHAVDAGSGHVWIAGSSSRGRCADSRPAIWRSTSPRSAPVEMRLPPLGRGTLLHIQENGPSDVWAVGERGTSRDCEGYGSDRSMVLHWNGTSWKEVTLPRWEGSLRGIAVIGEDDVWVAGDEKDNSSYVTLMHYDGRRWKRQTALSEGGSNAFGLVDVPGTPNRLLAIGDPD
ncbi:hypothetical protein [Nonomuraea sp. NEAU-A123]|uniref:hypothetical protein n=1 Tax=Nonomuraea sp. NEAU-A123 TaxID=2839649 RepID=UPI001BE4337A|nr:hypothetical protein [Nonomuraea sp. NEAU-A123]MBT2229608.1 hypothetical protein [Nonomuraea sp. NEAU-A123]